jgi:hypothetical protein
MSWSEFENVFGKVVVGVFAVYAASLALTLALVILL